MIKIYTDGSARKNGKECGYGVVVLEDRWIPELEEECTILLRNISESCEDSTNNREEIKAILKAYEYIHDYNLQKVVICSDSAYCVNMINEWIDNWAKNGWRKYDNKEIQNLDLVKKLYEYKHLNSEVIVKKVEGHANDIGNEMADALATNDMKKFDKLKNFIYNGMQESFKKLIAHRNQTYINLNNIEEWAEYFEERNINEKIERIKEILNGSETI